MFDSQVRKISDHVYWMKAGDPDRPSLCAVVGDKRTVMLDAGASDEHARLFVDGLKAFGVRPPEWVVLTHWHWDHVFGANATGATVIAHQLTAERLAVMRRQEWTNAALDERVESGEEIAFCADDIKLELPEPRIVHIAPAEIVFEGSLELSLGDIAIRVQHVGGDHAADACVVHVPSDRLLFLSDCMYDNIYAPNRHLTAQKTLPLIDTLASIEAETYVEGHSRDLISRAEFDLRLEMTLHAAALADELRGDAAAIKAATPGLSDNEEWCWLVDAFCAGITR